MIYISSDGITKYTDLPIPIEVGERLIFTYSDIQRIEMIVYKIVGDNVYISGDKIIMGLNVKLIGKNGYLRTIDTNQVLALSINTIRNLEERITVIEKIINDMNNTESTLNE